ncbi:MAG: hypothetical protein LUB61_03925 [Eggerthellaceae bacterium]|nr:hypothetical protein [Eggerthellaceae bacterium]
MSAQDSMVGKTFGGRYEIKDRIGIGGMAEVYRAQDHVLGRVVAVKVMLPNMPLTRILREDSDRRRLQPPTCKARISSMSMTGARMTAPTS